MVPFPRTTADFHSEAKYRSSMEQAAAGDLGNVEVPKAGRHAGPLSTHSTRFFQSDSPFISSFPAVDFVLDNSGAATGEANRTLFGISNWCLSSAW